MKHPALKIMQWGALLASGVIAAQVAMIVANGKPFCINDGCGIVESLTTVPPLVVNLAGLLYFLVLFAACRLEVRSRHHRPGFDWLRLLLTLGLVAEGVLLSYQVVVIHTLCSYCLGIFAMIVLLNLLYGWQQIVLAAPLFAAVIVAFTALNFGPTLLTLQRQSMDAGSMAVRKSAQPPVKQRYLFFSSNCPHCRRVLEALPGCDSGALHLNPIDRVKGLTLPGNLTYSDGYSPALNRLVLSLLDIHEVPVLLVRDEEGMTLLEGEKRILDFFAKDCHRQAPQTSEAPAADNPLAGMSVLGAEPPQEGCNVDLDCQDKVAQPGTGARPHN